MLGPPDTVVDLGETEVSEDIFMEYLSSLGESTYRFSNFFKFSTQGSVPATSVTFTTDFKAQSGPAIHLFSSYWNRTNINYPK